jgi:sterol desaturase/sphingolipid hydroxylase (fatty acid hydroxylase superfamily)
VAIIADLLNALYTMPLEGAALWALVENVVLFAVALVIGHFLVAWNKERLVSPPAPPLTRAEVLLAASCVILNTVVTVAGVVLWRAGIIQLRDDYSVLGAVVDTLVLFFAMDFAMYVFHRVAHHPRLYPLIHRTHHLYENPRPLTLFVLNPFEVLGFGALWLVVLSIYHSGVVGILVYLTLNLAFGLVGHLGVEPMPGRWVRLPLVNIISTSTFHAEHHLDKDHNYGFYTLIWDRLFGTLSPEYVRDFETATQS